MKSVLKRYPETLLIVEEDGHAPAPRRRPVRTAQRPSIGLGRYSEIKRLLDSGADPNARLKYKLGPKD